MALAVAAFTAAACSPSGSSPTPPSSTPQASDAALRFTQCVREHGVDLPDPPPGAKTVQLPASAKSDQKAQQALTACQHFLAQGGQKDASDPGAQDKAVELARCLRAHGIKVVDPQPGQPLRLNVSTHDPVALKAVQDCRGTSGSGHG